MSRWVRGIYNAAANFVMSGSLRAASGRTMDRDAKRLCQESDKSNQSGEPCQSSKSCGPTATTCSCTGTCSCSTARATTCSGSTASSCTSAKDGKLPNNHGDSCTCSLCRDYADYISSTGSGTIRTEGQGAGSRIRFSHEPRHTQQADGNAATTIEHITGIPTGVTL